MCYSYFSVYGFVVFTTRRFMLHLVPCSRVVVFSVLFSIMITSLGEDRAGLYASHAFAYLFCMRYLLSCFSSSS